MKRVTLLILSLLIVCVVTIPAVSKSNNIKFITDKNQMKNLMRDKGIYEEGEEVITLIEYTTYDSSSREPKYKKNLHAKKIGNSSISSSEARTINNYPGGSFSFTSDVNVGWQINKTFGLSIDTLSDIIGYPLNQSIIETWSLSSPMYSTPIRVKVYPSYDKEYYDIYKKNRYVGRTMIMRETGYTIKVTRQ